MTIPATAGGPAPASRMVERELLRDAAQWRLLGLLLSAPHGGWREEIAALADEVDDAALQEAARLALDEADEALYHSAFGPGGPAAPREVSHRQATLSGQYLAELSGYYQAFGYAAPYDEPADHVGVETDFVAYLRLKQAYAAMRGDQQQASSAEEAAAHVITEHLAMIAVSFAERLKASEVRYIRLAAEALCNRVGPPRSTPAVQLPILDESPDDDWRCCGDGERSDDDFAA